MALIVKIVGGGVLLPAAVAGVVMAIAWRAWSRSGAPIAGGRWGGAAGFALAFLAGYVGILGRPPLKPVESTHWLFYLVAVAGLAGVVHSLLPDRIPKIIRAILPVLITAALVALTVKPMIQYSWTTGQAAAWIAGLSAMTLALWAAMAALAERLPGPALPAAWTIAAAGLATVIGISGSASYGQLAGTLASALGAAMVLASWKPDLSLARGAVAPMAVIYAGLLINGYFYANAGEFRSAWMVLAPLAAGVCLIPRVARMASWKSALIGAAATTLAILPPIIVAVVQFLSRLDEDYYY